MDMRQLELDMEGGVEDPKPLTGARGAGKIPRDPKILSRVVGAFNGAFKTTHGEYGMMVHRRVLLPPKPNAATFVVRRIIAWASAPGERLRRSRTTVLVSSESGAAGGGRQAFTERAHAMGLPAHRDQHDDRALRHLCDRQRASSITYGVTRSARRRSGKAMILAGCTYGMHLDMNPHHTGFVFANVRSIANKDYDAKLLTPQMQILPERYLEWSPKDFFDLMLRDPSPPGDGWTRRRRAPSQHPPGSPRVWHSMTQSLVGPSARARCRSSSRRSTRRESSFVFVPVVKRGNVANTRARSSGATINIA